MGESLNPQAWGERTVTGGREKATAQPDSGQRGSTTGMSSLAAWPNFDALPGRDGDGGGVQLEAELRAEKVEHHPFRAAAQRPARFCRPAHG